jgi:hypothetical protein
MNEFSVPPTLLAIQASHSPGFTPLVDSGEWRAALLNFSPELTPDRIVEFQRHNESHELFVLLQGRCILFIGDGNDPVTGLYAQDLEPITLYTVRQAVWHAHALSPDAKLLIVENRNTSRLNSPRANMTIAQRAELLRLTHLIWGEP